ncbi:MAG: hypothetical protein QGG40_19145, partial [Myxococcota bacterium]|nr:hypothetical protein [Myxococcota bacterium]
ASEYLLRSADYFHRHLLTSFLAVAALAMVADLSSRWSVVSLLHPRTWMSPDPTGAKNSTTESPTGLVVRYARWTCTGLVLWLGLDLFVWFALDPPGQVLSNDVIVSSNLRRLAVLTLVCLALHGSRRLSAIRPLPAPDSRDRSLTPRLARAWLATRNLATRASAAFWRTVGRDGVDGMPASDGRLVLSFAGILALTAGAGATVLGGQLMGLAVTATVALGIGGLLHRRSEARALLRTLLREPPPPEAAPLWVGCAILVLGKLLGAGNRSLAGFDLKPAELAPLFVGLGAAGLLVGMHDEAMGGPRTRGPDPRHYAIHLRITGWLIIVAGLCGALYAALGDFGPLMVLVPALVATTFLWAPAWKPPLRTSARARPQEPSALGRLVLGLTTLAVLAGLAWSAVEALDVVTSRFSEIPYLGSHLERAASRIRTHGQSWFTQEGEWVTRAHWIAASRGELYFGAAESFLSNLHSDLAFLALIQSMSLPRALLVLGIFVALAGALGLQGERC